MSFDAAKLAYAYSFLRRKYLGPRLTSGALESGKIYLIVRLRSGDDFRNLGAAANVAGTVFTATGTTPTAWTKSSVLREVKIAELRALSEEVYSVATDPILITSASFEGGAGSGVENFSRSILGMAIEKLLTEWDEDYDPPPIRSSGFVMQLGGYGATC